MHGINFQGLGCQDATYPGRWQRCRSAIQISLRSGLVSAQAGSRDSNSSPTPSAADPQESMLANDHHSPGLYDPLSRRLPLPPLGATSGVSRGPKSKRKRLLGSLLMRPASGVQK